jgi:hypothetical protein
VTAGSLAGVTALLGLADWIRALLRSRTLGGWGPPSIDLVDAVLFLAVSVGVIALLMTPASRRDFQQPTRTAGQR